MEYWIIWVIAISDIIQANQIKFLKFSGEVFATDFAYLKFCQQLKIQTKPLVTDQ